MLPKDSADFYAPISSNTKHFYIKCFIEIYLNFSLVKVALLEMMIFFGLFEVMKG